MGTTRADPDTGVSSRSATPFRRPLLLAALLAGVVVLGARSAAWAEREASPLGDWHHWMETDEHAAIAASARIAAGNWLDVPAYRPWFSWQAQYGTPEWIEAYRQQVAGIMDLAHDGPRRLLWVGQPVVGNPKVNATVERVNKIVQEEAATRPWVSYFDLAAVVVGPGGKFSEYVTLPGGKTVRCFAGDSVHLSMQCLDYSMGQLVPAIQALSQP